MVVVVVVVVCCCCCCCCWDIAASVRLVAICEPIANAAILPLIIFQNAEESNIPFLCCLGFNDMKAFKRIISR